MARKNEPQEGETCPCGAFNWVQYSNGLWYCRPCRAKAVTDYKTHLKATKPEKFYEQQRRYQRAARRRRKDQPGPADAA